MPLLTSRGIYRLPFLAEEKHTFGLKLVSHQAVIGNLFVPIWSFFKGKTCRAFLSPIDVRLSEYNAVQPDLVVVCKPEIVTQTHIDGPPTLVVEVLSPSTQRHDRVRKLRLYASFGIEECWLIQPSPALVEVLSLDGDTYRIACRVKA